MISKQDVEHIAKLARLGLTPLEVKKFQGELSKILDYIEKLREVDVSKTEPTFHSIKIENVTREDEPKEKKLELRKKLVEIAPEKKEGYLKTKPIF